MADSKLPERLVESIAEGMWYLIREDSDQDWGWCKSHKEGVAAELRYRARSALIAADFRTYFEEKAHPTSLDLRFKDAMIRGELK
jgi:hypothetical protein